MTNEVLKFVPIFSYRFSITLFLSTHSKTVTFFLRSNTTYRIKSRKAKSEKREEWMKGIKYNEKKGFPLFASTKYWSFVAGNPWVPHRLNSGSDTHFYSRFSDSVVLNKGYFSSRFRFWLICRAYVYMSHSSKNWEPEVIACFLYNKESCRQFFLLYPCNNSFCNVQSSWKNHRNNGVFTGVFTRCMPAFLLATLV